MATNGGGSATKEGVSAATPARQLRALPSTSQSQSRFVPEVIPRLFPVPDSRTFNTKIPETVYLPFLEEGNELVKKEVSRLQADKEYRSIEANSASYVLNVSVVSAHASANLILNKLMLANATVTAEMDRERKNPLLFRELGIRSIDWTLPMSAETLKFMAGLWLYRFAFQYRSQQRNELASGAVASGDYIRRQLAYFTAQNEPWMQKVGVAMTDWLTRVISSSSQSYTRLDSIMTSGVKPFIRSEDVNRVVGQNTALEQDLDQAKQDIVQLRAALTSLGGKYSGGAQENRSLAEWAQQQAELAQDNEVNRSSLILQLLAPSPAFVTTMLGLSRAPIIITASSLAQDGSGRAVGDDDVLQPRALPGYAPSSALVALMLRISDGGFFRSGGAAGGGGGGGRGGGGGGGDGGSRMDVDDDNSNNTNGKSGSAAVVPTSSVFPSASIVQMMLQLSSQPIVTSASAADGAGRPEVPTGSENSSRDADSSRTPPLAALPSILFPSASVVKMMLQLSTQQSTKTTSTEVQGTGEEGDGRGSRRLEDTGNAVQEAVPIGLFPSESLVRAMLSISTLQAPPSTSSTVTAARPPPAQRPPASAQLNANPRRIFPGADFVQSMLLMGERAQQQLVGQ